MNDNYYLADLLAALEQNIVMERYYPLIDCKAELAAILNKAGATRKNEVSAEVTEAIRLALGDTTARLFARYIHLYDFNKAKHRELKAYAGTEKYDPLAALLRLPGVRLLRAELYYNSGVSLEVLAEKSTTDIRAMVSGYIQRKQRPESLPQPKEVNCHRAVAKMLLHTSGQQ